LRAAAGQGQVSLGWNANTEPDLAGYRVYTSTSSSGPFALQASVAITRYLHTGLTNGMPYYYRVTAYDAGAHESAPSAVVSATPYDIAPYTYPPAATCLGVPNCNDAAGAPNNTIVELNGADSLTLAFGAGRGIIDGAGYDLVFYEAADPPGILVDYVFVDLSADGTTWYRAFAWEGVPGGVAGTNIDSYATDANGELENDPIGAAALYGAPPYQTGIALDIGRWTPAGYGYRYVRLTYPPGGADAAQIDAVRRLH
jgi:hypothetical protein